MQKQSKISLGFKKFCPISTPFAGFFRTYALRQQKMEILLLETLITTVMHTFCDSFYNNNTLHDRGLVEVGLYEVDDLEGHHVYIQEVTVYQPACNFYYHDLLFLTFLCIYGILLAFHIIGSTLHLQILVAVEGVPSLLTEGENFQMTFYNNN